ncbi:LysR family transcriptional regulator [Mesorhizobium sp. BR115XR7A]|uniref:helix-turn-helix domain-containing protein n=1 Tax=Mesorhizobium sp. BR115XR7A TaxID=2876645 RepID=UPI001CCB0DB4|nr:LysR family transcriptional regulator [Mesorhizobium sp. BR115XR7A]MBZ9905323.1 LysR family transcriptional regulator [Mesorhizobium sp. BR115XR7A]MBZ9930395.1 LysR family transcriptional regulator [Mesorhizobium sp. BR1-1-5]
MDFEAIDYFIKVAEAQSLSHAAKLYGLPKSSLSHKVRALEDSLGVALFVRDGRELHLSESGPSSSTMRNVSRKAAKEPRRRSQRWVTISPAR